MSFLSSAKSALGIKYPVFIGRIMPIQLQKQFGKTVCIVNFFRIFRIIFYEIFMNHLTILYRKSIM